MEILNSDNVIGKIWFISIKVDPILNYRNILLSIEINFFGENLKKNAGWFRSFFLELLAKFSEKKNQIHNLSDYIKFLSKKRFEVDNK